MREQPVVVALGGNAISPPGSASPIPAQYERTMETAHHLAHLTERPLVVTHGNGPQVGNLLLRSDLAAGVLPRLPLDTCVADTQGGMGFMLQQCLDNAFRQAGVRRSTVTVVTRTVVDAGDPAFRAPSKPIGDFYDEAEARRRMDTQGWVMREDAGRGWRRVVPIVLYLLAATVLLLALARPEATAQVPRDQATIMLVISLVFITIFLSTVMRGERR